MKDKINVPSYADIQAALLRERMLLESVTAATDVMLVYLDPDFNFVWVNRVYADTCNMAPEQMIGKNHFVLYPHVENELIFRTVRDTGKAVFYKDKPFEFPDQPERGVTYWDWSLAPDKNEDGQVVGLVFSLRETTPFVHVQQDARENEQKLKLFIERVPTGIAMLDRQMRYLAVSRRYLDDYRITDTDIIGRNHYEVFPEIPERWREVHRRCLSGETLRCEEEPFLRADGRTDWVRWEVRPWFASSGEIGGLILFTENITSRKQAEDALKAAKARAEQANRAKSTFLASVSHDLRQPLCALSLYVGLLGNELGPRDGSVLAHIKECVSNLNGLLSGLLDLSKLEAGVVKPCVGDFSVASLFTQMASSHRPEAETKGLALRFCHTAAVGRSDPVLFQRMVGNLVSNAIRYTERGGVLVACRRRYGKLWIEVWDTGIGIPEDRTAEIFEEFKQLGNTERNQAKGTGIGLAIVAKTASLLGLQIRMQSRLGKGSLFAIELPEGETLKPAIQPQGAHRLLRIALVEDNAEVGDALALVLRNAGHEVMLAPSRRELLLLLGGVAPDIVISDFRLIGEEDGVDVIEALRATFDDNLPAMIVTGDTDPAVIRLMANRRISIQHKPVEADGLLAKLAELTS